MKPLCNHKLTPLEQCICKSHQFMWDLCLNSMGKINPLANSLLDGAKKCFQTLELSYLYYADVGGKTITRMISILFSKNNYQELGWTKDHSQKGSIDAVILFWQLWQFKTTEIQQLASVAWDDLYHHFPNRDRHSHCFPSTLFLRSMKNLKAVDIKTHYSKAHFTWVWWRLCQSTVMHLYSTYYKTKLNHRNCSFGAGEHFGPA